MIVKRENTKPKGFLGENQVVSWLLQNGYTVLQQNFACKFGEIDIIAQKDEIVCFIEVKTRFTTYFDLSELVNFTKQKKIIATAKKYIALYGNTSQVYRFDVALVEKTPEGLFVNYIPNAFYGSEF
jgi:putative endonuclease